MCIPKPLAVSSALDKGLREVASDVPVRTGFLEGRLGTSLLEGPFARIAVGSRPTEKLAVYGFAEWNRREPLAGLGFSLRF